MSTENLLMITEKGVERWVIHKYQLKVNESQLMESIARNVVRKCEAVIKIGGPYGMACVSLKQTFEMWSVRVLKLSLECPFYLQDGVHTPAFADGNQAVMKLEWTPHMKVVLGITVHKDMTTRYAGDHYLIAFDARGNMWRMPVANLYEDGKLCHGQPSSKFDCSLDCVMDCCKRFSNSKWNADLYQLSDEKRFRSTRDMFRWAPDDKGFNQLPLTLSGSKDWTSLCQKISNETLQQLIMPV